MGAEKSIVVGGAFTRSTVAIQASTDGGASFQDVVVFDQGGKKRVEVVAERMRTFVRISPVPAGVNVDVGAPKGAPQFFILPLPAGDGPGAPVDVSDLGNVITSIVTGEYLGTTIHVEISQDNVTYQPCIGFAEREGIVTKHPVTTKFARAFVRGRTNNSHPFNPSVSLGFGFLAGGAAPIEFDVPITVRGDTNAEGVSDKVARADHQHRLEVEVEDEGSLAGARPTIDFVGAGVGAVDDPANDKVVVTIPGTLVDGAVVERDLFKDNQVQTTSGSFVDAMGGASVTVPIDGNYWAILEAESTNQSGSGILEVGIGVNGTAAAVANSERRAQGNANDIKIVTVTVNLGALLTGDTVHAIFRRFSGAGSVRLFARNLSIFKVQ
jgi:hypothetical protein